MAIDDVGLGIMQGTFLRFAQAHPKDNPKLTFDIFLDDGKYIENYGALFWGDFLNKKYSATLEGFYKDIDRDEYYISFSIANKISKVNPSDWNTYLKMQDSIDNEGEVFYKKVVLNIFTSKSFDFEAKEKQYQRMLNVINVFKNNDLKLGSIEFQFGNGDTLIWFDDYLSINSIDDIQDYISKNKFFD